MRDRERERERARLGEREREWERDGSEPDGAGGGRRWDAVLFDLDGTLADSIGLILLCYRHTLRTHLGQDLVDALWLENMGRPLRVQLAAFARSDAELDAMAETYIRHQRLIHDEHVRPFPGVAGVLDRLAAAGTRLGIVTSKRREMTLRTLRACGIETRFQAVVTPDDVQRPKPDPEPVLAAIAALGDPDVSRVLMVGDAPVDILAGRAAGVRTAAALWGQFPRAALEAALPDYWCDRLEDLLTLDGRISP